MYKSILNCDNKEPILCKDVSNKERKVVSVSKIPGTGGVEMLSHRNTVDGPVRKAGCGFVVQNGCLGDGRQVAKGPNVGLSCDKTGCDAVMFPNASVPIDTAPQQSRKLNTSPDDIPSFNTTMNYRNYSDINIGDHVYYVDKELASPYHNPNYTRTGKVTKKIFTDPMGRTSLEFSVDNLTETGNEMSDYKDLAIELGLRHEITRAVLEKSGNRNDYSRAYYS